MTNKGATLNSKKARSSSNLLDELLAQGVAEGVFPSAAFAVGDSERVVFGFENAAEDALWDLASLTKVLATTTAVALQMDQGAFDLAARVRDYIAGFDDRATLWHLLTHTSGLPAHREYWKLADSPEGMWDRILSEPLIRAPGEAVEYSCVGFLNLQRVLLKLTAEGYEDAWSWGFHRLMEHLGAEFWFCPTEDLKERCVVTEEIRGRDAFGTAGETPAPRDAPDLTFLKGVVHDENARYLGGLAANAGLFGTTQAVVRLARWWMNEGEGDVDPAVIRRMVARQPNAGTRALGWDTKSEHGYTSCGAKWGAKSYGHTGFTGTSLWIDPEAKRFCALLTNRVALGRENEKIRDFRPRFADAAWDELDKLDA